MRAQRILHHRGEVVALEATGPDGRRIPYRPRALFVAAGPIGPPVLLRRSGIHPRTAGRRIGLHLNLRTVARFSHVVDAARGTMFTAQVQELPGLTILVIPSNMTPGGWEPRSRVVTRTR